MTEPATGVCGWCERRFEFERGPGRPPRYCRRSCRQRAYEHRLRMRELETTEHELVITRREVEQLRDQLFEFSLAVEDIERDLGRSPASAGDVTSEVLAVVRSYLDSVAGFREQIQ